MADVVDTIRDGLVALLQPGQVVELRALDGRKRVTAGYFNAPEKLAQEAARLDRTGRFTVYFTPNTVNPACIARADNHLVEGLQPTTSDKEIARRRFLLVDVDPVRPAGIGSTNAEHDLALARAVQIRDWLAAKGWPAPAEADSGNGAHLMYRLDEPNDAETTALVQRCLQALDVRFSDDLAKVDTAVFNAARIWKLPGTTARKGDSTPERPHRRARLLSPPSSPDPVTRGQLEELAAIVPKEEPRQQQQRQGGGAPFDLLSFFAKHGIAVARTREKDCGTVHELERCPFDESHTGGCAVVMVRPGGAMGFECRHDSCQRYHWQDFRQHFEPGYQERRDQAEARRNGKANGARHPNERAPGEDDETGPPPSPSTSPSWPAPQQFVEELRPVPPFSLALVPEALRPWIEDAAERLQVPPELVAVPAFIALGAIIGRRCVIRPKRHDDWTCVPNLWGAGLGHPGLLKSPAADEALTHLKRLQALAWERFDREMKAANFDRQVTEARRKAHKAAIDRAAKAGDNDAIDKLREEAATLVDKPLPTPTRYFVNDATTEKLQEILAANANGILLVRDELLGWFRGLERDGHEDARAFYLECWSGLGSFTVDRIGRGTVRVDSTCLSIWGTTQPGPFARYIGAAIKGAEGADGLAQRFQLLVYPDAGSQWQNVDRWPHKAARERAWDVFRALAEADLSRPDRDDELPAVHFCERAQEKFDEWRSDLERRLRTGDDHPALLGHLAKYRSLVPSIALIHHLADRATATEYVMLSGVSEDSLDAALGWASYLEEHARRIYGVALADDSTTARLLAKKLESGIVPDGFTARDIKQRNWTGLTGNDELQEALELLEELRWIRSETVKPTGKGGRPSVRYWINPTVGTTKDKAA